LNNIKQNQESVKYKSVKQNLETLTGHDLIAAREEYLDISPKQEMENTQEKEILQKKEIQFCQNF
jgi:hypothetical protein